MGIHSDSEFEFISHPFDANYPFFTSNYDDEVTSESEEDDSDGEEDVDAALNADKWISSCRAMSHLDRMGCLLF